MRQRTEAELQELGEKAGRAIVNTLVLIAASGIGVQFHSWVIGLAVGLGLLFLHGINHRLGKLVGE